MELRVSSPGPRLVHPVQPVLPQRVVIGGTFHQEDVLARPPGVYHPFPVVISGGVLLVPVVLPDERVHLRRRLHLLHVHAYHSSHGKPPSFGRPPTASRPLMQSYHILAIRGRYVTGRIHSSLGLPSVSRSPCGAGSGYASAWDCPETPIYGVFRAILKSFRPSALAYI